MLEFARILFPKIGIDTPVEQYRYLPEDFGTCNYFIGNSKFWTNYLGFIDLCLKLCDEDNDYASEWNNELKIENFFTTWKEQQNDSNN